jgi:hypothetical protein
MTWEEIAAIEPRFYALYFNAIICRWLGMNSREAWCRHIRRRMIDLVGDYAEEEALRTSEFDLGP